MKAKTNKPSKDKIKAFDLFFKCFISWFLSLKKDQQEDFCKIIHFDISKLD